MNDDFLRRARRPPPAAFANQLRERLRQQELAPTSRGRPGWKLWTATLLIAGTALATATYLTLSDAPLQSFFTRQTTQAHADTEANAPGIATRRNGAYITTDPTIETHARPAHSPQPQPSTSDFSNRSSSSAEVSSSDAAAASQSYSPTYPGVWTTAPSLRILVSHDLAAVTKDSSPRSTTPATFNPTSADAALRALCSGEPEARPEIVIASRRMRPDESKLCDKRGEDGLLEAKLGHFAVVVTRAKSGNLMQLSVDNVFRALVKSFPSPQDPTRLVANPYTHWNQIDPTLEDRRIEVFGPARDSPEFTALAVALLEPACDRYSEIRALHDSDRNRYEQICHGVRDDGAYVPARFDSNFIQQRLWSDPAVVAIIDYRFYARNSDDLLGSLLKGVTPTREAIVDGSYDAARTLYLYVPRAHHARSPAVSNFVTLYLRLEGLARHKALLPPDVTIDAWGPPRPAQLTELKLQ